MCEFKVGMKVKATKGNFAGVCGVIRVVSGRLYGVDFKGEGFPIGHDLGGSIKTDTGWWIDRDCAQPMEIVNV